MPSYECYFYVYHCNDISNDNKRRVINVCVCVCVYGSCSCKEIIRCEKKDKREGGGGDRWTGSERVMKMVTECGITKA